MFLILVTGCGLFKPKYEAFDNKNMKKIAIVTGPALNSIVKNQKILDVFKTLGDKYSHYLVDELNSRYISNELIEYKGSPKDFNTFFIKDLVKNHPDAILLMRIQYSKKTKSPLNLNVSFYDVTYSNEGKSTTSIKKLLYRIPLVNAKTNKFSTTPISSMAKQTVRRFSTKGFLKLDN